MMKKVNILITVLGVLGVITQTQAKVGYGISQQETKPHILLGEKKGDPALGISSIPGVWG
ncbi:hypothetical protein [Xenorhabdus hominickii]|uniref:Uncharacterized protein n=1 Tax=Xenorhabdus hominickii TaxID=351679 RepID=A0A2G0PXH8_XENHO|nr:hypothetical protein [Xenorhabdus hominickii]PHM51672.1 hypothetical protein Xhom_04806 [Xenorhabdus hominickii]PHM54305.1 hypothetical protein Xhom_03382 [Xenorhabdus hominickii]